MGDRSVSEANERSLAAEPTVVGVFRNSIAAHAARLRLLSAGIEARVVDEHLITFYPILDNAVGGVKLLVSGERLDDAREILETRVAAPVDEESIHRCPECDSVRVRRGALGLRLAFLTVLLCGIPFGRARARLRCQDCGHRWRE